MLVHYSSGAVLL